MRGDDFNPNPMETQDITIPSDLLELTEKLAEHVHEIWARGRIQEGWVYGDSRDQEKKITPCLVPYDKLPEGEKEYDRKTALETIKLIIKLGYRIEKE